MGLLIVGCLVFLLSHLGISGTPIRSLLIENLGSDVYLVGYSMVSLFTLSLMIYGYAQASQAEIIWYTTPILNKISKFLVFVAFLLVLPGLMTANPTAVKSETALENEITGMLKITRHPLQWGILLFSMGHLISNGDMRSLFFFGTLAALSLFGMFSMDSRRRRETDPLWQSFMVRTSMWPFVAVLDGRQKMRSTDLHWIGLFTGAALYALIYVFHDWVSGGIRLI